jgi:DNA-binding SARP family transcriptional activator/tetratricopeptide (TPR) repeat protein
VEVAVLGAFAMSVNGVAVPLVRRQQRLFVALLALNANVAVSSDRIAELMWDGEAPPTARNQIQVLVCAIRKAVRAGGGPASAITTSALGYRLNAPPVDIDLHAFERDVRLAEEALTACRPTEAADRFRLALGRWRGPPLTSLTGRFAEAEAARLEERRLAVLLRCVDVELVLGRLDDMVAELTRQTADRPLHEGLRSRLMLALYALGRPADALGVYRAGAHLLAEEQGMVRPGERLRAVHRGVLRAEPVGELISTTVCPSVPSAVPAPLTPIPSQLPGEVHGFTGRVRCLQWLDRVLADPGRGGGGISLLSGTAGVGKTAVAVHWAHRVRNRFPDGQLYLDLRGFSSDPPVQPAEALARMLSALGMAPADVPADEDARAALYRSLVADRRVLVVLDNAATPRQVRPLLPGAAGCHVVVTSRHTLSGIVAREGARRTTLDLLPLRDAVLLLRRLVGAERVDREQAVVAEVVERCARLPLALRVLAERIVSRPELRLDDLRGELSWQEHRLDVLATPDDETAAMRPVFSWSYRALEPAAGRMFRLLGLHPGPHLGAPAAGALAADRRPERLLDVLTGAHLLTEVGPSRYQLHDLLRCYAIELAELDAAERDRAVRDVLGWYLRTADAANTVLMPQRLAVPIADVACTVSPLSFGSRERARAWFETEHANLVAAVIRAEAAGLDDLAWQLPATLWSFFYLSKRWSDWTETHRIGLAAAKRLGDDYGEARMLHSLGTAAWNQQRPADAREYYERALLLWRRRGDRLGESQTMNNLGATLCDLRSFGSALRCYRRALSLRTEIGDRRGEGQTLNNLGEAHRELGRFDDAIGYFRRALEIHLEVNDEYGQGQTLTNLGMLHCEVHRTGEAIGYFERALTVRRRLGDRLGVVEALRELGRTFLDSGDLGAARSCRREALDVMEGMTDPTAARLRARLDELTRGRPAVAPTGPREVRLPRQ